MERLTGITPAREVKPTLGLMPTIAFLSAGLMTLPSVSVPMLTAMVFAPTPTAEPELLPPGLTVRLYALLTCPPLPELRGQQKTSDSW